MPTLFPDDDALAADPGAQPGDLYRIAQDRPDLWPVLLANPATYLELREWLAGQEAPSSVVTVTDALAASAVTPEAAGFPFSALAVSPVSTASAPSSGPTLGGGGAGVTPSSGTAPSRGLTVALVVAVVLALGAVGTVAGVFLSGRDHGSPVAGDVGASASAAAAGGTDAAGGATAGGADLSSAGAASLDALSASSCSSATSDADILVSYGEDRSTDAGWTTTDGANSVILAMSDLRASCGQDYTSDVAQTAVGAGASQPLAEVLGSYTGGGASPAPASAYSYQYIDTPSKNISCELHDSYVACSILERSYSAATDCSSRLFSISVDSSASSRLRCGEEFLGAHGMTFHELGYGESTTYSTFACTERETGMTCWNTQTGHGFTISPGSYTQF